MDADGVLARPVPRPGKDAASLQDGEPAVLDDLHDRRVDGVAVRTGYGHASGYVVRPGDRVVRGQLLGSVGSTGYSTGCHLHLQVWLDGQLADPSRWFTL